MGDALNCQALGMGASEPRWLGDRSRYLYAVLQRAAVPGNRLGVVLVPPLFHEQPRSRRLLMQVAEALSALGLPSIRFDFFGTGDSAGSSEQVDFRSMCVDLELACRALSCEPGVERVALLAWRGGALPVARWLRDGNGDGDGPALVVLWEPIVDGAQWLRELEADDRAERRSVSRYRLCRPSATSADDQQLMGVAVSARLRSDIAGVRLDEAGWFGANRCWAVLRPGAVLPASTLERVFDLPPDSPTFGGGTQMDSGLFVTPQLRRIANELGRALLQAG